MLNVATVEVGNYCGRGKEYVHALFDMVSRNLPAKTAGRFVVLTDDVAKYADNPEIVAKVAPPGLKGWWNKLALFKEDTFPKGERVLYFDLDTCITGPLDQVSVYQGPPAILRDVYRSDGLQSSVMAWEAGTLPFLYWQWIQHGRRELAGGDQEWLEQFAECFDILQDLFPGKFRSYKAECRASIPRGTSVVFFHGHPRPHEVTTGWVPEVWKVGGGSGLEFVVQSNTSDETLCANVRSAMDRDCQWLKTLPEHNVPALIVGGGPSLAETLFYIRGMKLNGCRIFATNNAYRYLKDNGIQPDAHVLLDARPENMDFVPDDAVPKLYASQCHPETLGRAGQDLICWHAHQTCYHEMVSKHETGEVEIGGGSTVGLKAMAIAYALGYRELRLFGFDSSYRESHHAYPQPLNDNEKRVTVKVAGHSYTCAPWMVSQAEEFKETMGALVRMGCMVTVYGDGMLPAIAQQLSRTAADERAEAILKHIYHMQSPVGAEIGVYMGTLSKRLLRQREDLKLYLVDCWAPQAGDYEASGDFHASMSKDEHEEAYRETLKGTQAFRDRVVILRDWSAEAAKHVPDRSLDFVFIDANHSYEGCKEDLALWASKVRPGGVLAGHDYAHPEFPQWGVEKAVNEYASERSLTVQTDANYTWFIHLPQESRLH